MKRLKLFINYGVGPLLFIYISFSIAHQVQQQKGLAEAWHTIVYSFTGPQCWKIGLVLALMLVNWALEAKKWQLLVKDIQPISFWKSYKAIFSGQSVAFNTVNNVGEYVGRVMHLEEGHRLKAVSVTIVGSISQIIATLVMGLVGLFYAKYYLPQLSLYTQGINSFWLTGLIYALSVITIIVVLFFYSLSWITILLEKLPILHPYIYLIEEVEHIHWKELTKLLALSFIRYFVFVFQYLLLFQTFQVEANPLSLCFMVCIMFLVLAIIPSVALAELGLRGEVSKQLLGLVSTNILGITFTTLLIWCINRVIPALAGTLFILGIRLFKKI